MAREAAVQEDEAEAREAFIRETAARANAAREAAHREADAREAAAREIFAQEVARQRRREALAMEREADAREEVAREAAARQRRRDAIAEALAQYPSEDDSEHEDNAGVRSTTPRPNAEAPRIPTPSNTPHRRGRSVQPAQSTTPSTPQRRSTTFDREAVRRAIEEARAQDQLSPSRRMNMMFDGPVSPSGNMPFGGEFSLSLSLSQGQGPVGVATAVSH